MRLNKYLAQSGECSRRQADKNVLDGMVTVNGILELNPAYHVSDLDEVRFDGRKIYPEKKNENYPFEQTRRLHHNNERSARKKNNHRFD